MVQIQSVADQVVGQGQRLERVPGSCRKRFYQRASLAEAAALGAVFSPMQPTAMQAADQSKLIKLDAASGSLLDGTQRTVVDFGKIPKGVLHNNDFLNFLLDLGFEPTDLLLLYLKIDFVAEKPEYAWVAFANHQLALQAGAQAEARGLETAWVRDPLQNVTALKQHFKTNAMMHPSVRSDLQPRAYEAGEEVPFPQPDHPKKPGKPVVKHIQQFLRKHFPNGPPAVKRNKINIIASPGNDYEIVTETVTKNTFINMQEHVESVMLPPGPHPNVLRISQATIFQRLLMQSRSGQVDAQYMKDILEKAKRVGTQIHNSWV